MSRALVAGSGAPSGIAPAFAAAGHSPLQRGELALLAGGKRVTCTRALVCAEVRGLSRPDLLLKTWRETIRAARF